MSTETFPCKDNLSASMRARLKKIRYIISDLDGTMITHGKATVNSAGEPSAALVQTLVELAQAGISIIPCTGRNRAMILEDTRLLGLSGYIAELGGVLCTHQGSIPKWTYFTGELEYQGDESYTPHDMITENGVIDRLLERFAGSLEHHHDSGRGLDFREVTFAMRGSLDEAVAQQILDESGLPLYLADNGLISRINGPTTLKCDIEHPENIRTYHVVPRGVTKGSGIKRFCELMNWSPEEVLGAGDSPADLEIADNVGTFLLMKNALRDPKAKEGSLERDNVFISTKDSTDGWIDAMQALLEAHRS